MAIKTDAELQAEIDLIKDETVENANTAARIGGTLENIKDSAQLREEGKSLVLNTEVSKLLYSAIIFNVKSFGAMGNGSTDDTAAIQSCINACFAGGGGKVWFPAGTYIIAGDLQTSINSTNPNSQLYFPLTRIGIDNGCSITFEGEAAPNKLYNYSGGIITTTGGVVLLSTIAGSGTLPAVFGTPTYSSALGAWNHTYVSFKNIVIRTKTHSGSTHIVGTMSAINAENMSNFCCDELSLEITSAFNSMVSPTNETYGIIFPKQLNYAYTGGGTLRIMGYKYGMVPCEHLNLNQAYISFCNSGVYVKNAGQHGAQISCLSVESCKYYFRLSANQSVHVSAYHAEHHPDGASWYGFEQDVYVTDTSLTRGIYFDHTNLGTWGVVGGVEYDFKTNSPKHTSFRFLNGRDIDLDLVAVAHAGTWNAFSHKRASITLTVNTVLTISNARPGEMMVLFAIQDGTGGRTLTINDDVITIEDDPNARTLVTCCYTGTDWFYIARAEAASTPVDTVTTVLKALFTGANSSSNPGNLDVPAATPWGHVVGTWGISSNKGINTNPRTGSLVEYFLDHNSGLSDFTLTATVIIGAKTNIGLTFRKANDSNYMFVQVAAPNGPSGAGGYMAMYKVISGVITAIGTTHTYLSMPATCNVRIVALGQVISVYNNDVLLPEFSGSTGATGLETNTGAGIRSAAGNLSYLDDGSTLFDDFIVTE